MPKKTFNDFSQFEIGALYEIQKDQKKSGKYAKYFDTIRFATKFDFVDVCIGEVVVCLSKHSNNIAADFLLPNGDIGTISVFNFIPHGFVGLKLAKAKKEKNNAKI